MFPPVKCTLKAPTPQFMCAKRVKEIYFFVPLFLSFGHKQHHLTVIRVLCTELYGRMD